MHKFLSGMLLLLGLAVQGAPPRVQIIPQPVSVTEREGSFRLTASTRLYTEDKTLLPSVTGFQLKSTTDSSNNVIIIKRGASDNAEGYTLDIGQKTIHITASTAAGVFYAFQSLQQLKTAAGTIPCATITDYPRYAYRGMHLDVSRHFFKTDFIKQYLELLARYKINTFHWHLTDSHGWRLEIKQYPRLTSVGAWRADRSGIPMTIAEPTAKDEPATYGGYYTQEEVKAIVQFAKERFITVIPEIEMPGHCTAALVAYPQFSDLNNPTPLLMPCGYAGDLLHNFCAGYDSTFIFLQNILKEVMTLFPSPYIHIGGDEVRGGPWMTCPRCRQRMTDNGLTNARQLQAWFTHRIDSFITVSGRKMIGWDEILESDLRPGGGVMSWHGDIGVKAGTAKGLQVVMSPYRYTYFDFYQSDPALEPDITYAPLSLDSVYAFNPTPAGLTPDELDHIAGGEACLWTENVPTPARVEYMLLPRMLALSEVLWTPYSQKNYSRFVTKTEKEFTHFDATGIHYAKSLYNVNIRPTFDSTRQLISVALAAQARKYQVRYTLDGTTPTTSSKEYTSPLILNKPGSITLQTALFNGTRQMGKTNSDSFYLPPPSIKASIDRRLTDGIFGTVEPYDGRWVSFTDSIVTLTIDLKATRPIHAIGLHCKEDAVGNIFLPKALTIEGAGEDEKYATLSSIKNEKIPEQALPHTVTYKSAPGTIRYIRIKLYNANKSAEKDKNLLFVDEITIK